LETSTIKNGVGMWPMAKSDIYAEFHEPVVSKCSFKTAPSKMKPCGTLNFCGLLIHFVELSPVAGLKGSPGMVPCPTGNDV
jgi:hypothetical protein